MCYDPISLILTGGLILIIAFGTARLIHTLVILARVRKMNTFLISWLAKHEKQQPAVPVEHPIEALTIRVRPTKKR